MIDALTTLLSSQMMQRSLLAALIVGLTAPIIGTYLVHRRLAMLGDGIGHISLTGVALGWLAGTFANVSPADSWAIPGAVIISLLGAITIELVRQSGRTSGDTALAMLFYGGIAGGVLLIGLAGGTSAQLNSYLFGSISTVRWSDITLITLLGVAIVPGPRALLGDQRRGLRTLDGAARAHAVPAHRYPVGADRGRRDAGRRLAAGQRTNGYSRGYRPARSTFVPLHDGHRDGSRRHHLHVRAVADVLR